jgi:hypothetical protein
MQRRFGLKHGLAAAGLLAAAAVAVGVRTHQEPDVVATADVTSAAPLARAAEAAQVYRVRYTSRVTTDAAEAVASLELEGSLTLVAAGAIDAQPVLQARLSSFTLRSDAPDPSLSQTLEKPFYLALGPNGGVSRVWTEKGLSSLAQSTIKALLAPLQLAPASREGTSVQTERDGAGEYRAEYRRVDGAIEKRKLSYVPVAGQPAQKILESKARITLDGKGALRSLSAKERLSARPVPELPEFIAETQLQLESTSGVGTAASPPDTSRLESSLLSDPPTTDARRADVDRNVAKSASLEKVLQDLGSESSESRTSAYNTLVAKLRSEPTSVTVVASQVRSHPGDASALIAALGDAGGEPCQTELISLLKGTELSAPQQRAVLQALGRTESPNARVVARLQALLDDPNLGFQAKLSLGSAIFRLKEHDPRTAHDALSSLLAGARGAGARIEYLKALGNAGHPDSVTTLVQVLGDSDATLRAAAAAALRRVTSADVDPVLVRVLESEPEPSVRLAALEAVRSRPATDALLRLALELAERDADRAVRIQAIALAADFGRTHQTELARRTLVGLVERERDEAVRSSANHALERLAQAG